MIEESWWERLKNFIFPEKDHIKKIRICPKCGSKNVQLSKAAYWGDPLKIEAMVGWDCIDCKHTGRDFIYGDEETVEEFRKKLKK